MTWGWLVDQGEGRLVLLARDGNRWPVGPGKMARYLTAGPRNTVEGLHRAPRPWVYDALGNPVVKGDYVLIAFINGDPKSPVILPGVAPLDPEDPDFLPGNPLGEDPNPIRGRWAARDARTGAVTGHLQVQALDGGNTFEIVAGGASFGEGVRLLLDFDAGQIKVGRGDETHQVGFGEEIVQAIKTLAEAILAVDASQAAKLPSSAPVATATVTQVLADCTASLSAGAPMLSTIVKVQ